MYPAELTEPMRAELTDIGVEHLTTAAEVDAALQRPGTTLVFINSVCGCAAGLTQALSGDGARPDHITSVFAGVDREAVDQARSYLVGYPPSSPSAALLKDGDVVWMLHRHQIEGRPPEQIAQAFAQAFADNA